MRTVYLPSKDSKDNPRVEKVTNTKLLPPKKNDKGEDVPQGITFEIPAERFGYPQFDSLAEAETDAGSAEKLLEFINKAAANTAVTLAKNAIRNATKSAVGQAGQFADVVDAGIQKGITYSLAIVEELTTKEKASAFDQLVAAAKSGDMTSEQIAEAVKKLSGLA